MADMESRYLEALSKISGQLREAQTSGPPDTQTPGGDRAFRELLGDFNLSFLQTSVLHYTDEDRQLMEAVQLMVEQVRCRLSYGGDLLNIGSCQDGTKVQRLDEMDILYVLPPNRNLVISRTEIPHVYEVRDCEGNSLNPREERQKFADELEKIFEEIVLPPGLEHCGFMSPTEFSGIRYNGPAATTLFTWQKERDISIDMTLVYQLPPEDRADMQAKIKHRCKRLFEENSQKLFHVKGTYLYPNIVTDRWELSTAYCEADILANLPTEAPFKLAVQVSKIICSRLAAYNMQKFHSGSQDSGESKTDPESEMMSKVEACEDRNKKRVLMRYGHVFLLPEECPPNNEQTKKLISINTAAVKHIALAVASKLAGAFTSKSDHANIMSHLLSEIFMYLGGSEISVNHFFLDSAIGLFAIAPWAASSHNIIQIVRDVKWECKQIAWTLNPGRFGLGNIQTHQHDLQNCVLSPGELSSEDTCRVKVDFTGKGCNISFDILMKLINGLANSFGGIILLDGTDVSQNVMEIWKAAFLHHVQMSTGNVSSLNDLVHVMMSGHRRPYIYVERAKGFWTLNSNICVYDNGISFMARDPDDIPCKNEQQSDSQVIDHSQMSKETYKEAEEIKIPSNSIVYCSEFRLHNKELTTDGISLRLLELPILSMPNMASGGLILLGVREVDGKLLATGVKLNAMEQAMLKKSLEDMLGKCPITKEKRVWGHTNPLEWDIRFLPVEAIPEHVVVYIHIPCCTGGLYYACPESYSFSTNGTICPVAYQEWKSKVPGCQFRLLDHQNSHSSQNSQLSNTVSSATKIKENNMVLGDSNTKTIQQKVEPYLQKATQLSWIDNTDDWRNNLVSTSRLLGSNAVQLSGSDIFQFMDPLHFTPPSAVMCETSSVVTERTFDAIAEHHSPKAGFGIGAANFSSLIECPYTENAGGLDILTVDEGSNVELWTMCKTNDEKTQTTQAKHVMTLGASMKKHILSELDQHVATDNKRPNIVIGCHVLDETCTENPLLMSGIVSTFVDNTLVPIDHLCAALAKIFLSRETLLKSRLGREIAVNLTDQQFQQELQSMFRIFNVVEGPPGSGKTILALRTYLSYAKSTAVFVAINPAMKSFLEYQGVEDVILLRKEQDITKLTTSGILRGVQCVILDDVQHLVFPAKSWNKLFQHIRQINVKLYAFMDNACQSFNIVKNSDSFLYHLEKFCAQTNTNLNVRHLDEVHRNSRKMVSYIKECHSEMESIPCSSIDEGDDVTIVKMAEIRNNKEGNPLVEYIRMMTSSPEKWDQTSSYLLTDIAVLLDGINCEDDVDVFRTILREQGPFAVQEAGVFPVTGLTVDALDKFVGLDAEVVIFVTSEEIINQNPLTKWRKSSKKRSLLNGRYKAFISSRAVSKLVFIVETNINLHITKNLHFNPDKLSRTVEKSLEEERIRAMVKLWHIGQQRAYTSACFLRRGQGWVLLCVTFRPSMSLIDVNTGEELPLDDLGFDPSKIIVADVSLSQKYVVMAHKETDQPRDPWKWRVFYNNGTDLKEVSSHPIRWIPKAITCTPEDDVLILVYKDRYRQPHLLKYRIDGQLLWDYNDEITRFDVPEDLAVGQNGKIYVAEYYNHAIRVLTPKGHFSRNIPHTLDDFVLYSPKALCVDSTGRWLWVSLSQPHRKHLAIVSSDGKEMLSVLELDSRAYSVDVLENRLLVVGTKKGLMMYDIRSVYSNLG